MATRLRSRKGHWWVYLILTIGLVAVVSPFLWMLVSSVKPDREINSSPPTWLPESYTGEHYAELFRRLDLTTYLTNSVLVAVAVTLGNLVFCSMLGYVLTKISFSGRRLLFGLVMGMLMVPGMVTFVPLFILVSNAGMANSYAGLILPFLVQPVGVFLMRQFIGDLPDELIDAARVDGAGEPRIFAGIVLPLCGPALATLGIITFLSSWNNFLWPLVVAQTEDMYTMPVALALYSVGQNSIEYGLLLAGAVVVVVPVLVLFVALQKHFTQGIATTGFK
ncbi:multiple sugar transport system permease protein [Kibdelosporangium banguiense]|uniref:Multiple sugar transport system permease protein n=1 Tax=Kibdelosporangium banguiense TaxID=1365924 RepID=A0ABS4TPM7_9PSEU|nr:carbohydrate ABC transporter permease [Kibdelosporangium banguiense]MBP2326356.1 multiple sugar transport system permease protein [Kibdelosporangium banguiense]